MGDLVLRVSLLVQRGWACQVCGWEIDGQMTGVPRRCLNCMRSGVDTLPCVRKPRDVDSADSAAPVSGDRGGSSDER